MPSMDYDRSQNSRYVDYTRPGPSGVRGNSVGSYDSPPPLFPASVGGHHGREGYTNPSLESDVPGDPPSDRADSEYTIQNEALVVTSWEDEHRAVSRTASEIYEATRFDSNNVPYSEASHPSYRSGRESDIVSVKTKTTRSGKLVLETMTAPHPWCPNTKSVCCLLALLNLALLLITLGFIVVLQLSDPAYVWYVGVSMLIVGFSVLFGSLVYCIIVCREVEHLRPPPGELYWTNHWTKTVNLPEIHYSNTQHKPPDYKGFEFSFHTEPSRSADISGQNY